MRSFMGLVEQTSPFLKRATQLHPFRDLLKTKTKEEFKWNPDLELAFNQAKQHLIQESEEGIRQYSRGRTTMVTTDWSKEGMGCTIFQKYCECQPNEKGISELGCCIDGWKLVLTDSRFCNPAENTKRQQGPQ